jgi:hypothetical protein
MAEPPGMTDDERRLIAGHTAIVGAVFAAIEDRAAVDAANMWDYLHNLTHALDRLGAHGMHPDDRAGAREALGLLAGLWLGVDERERLYWAAVHPGKPFPGDSDA